MKHLIDTNKAPKIPYDDWKIESHTKMGNLDWDKIKPELYLSEKQNNGFIIGNNLREELEDKNPLNANVLDYLLDNPELIPSEWRGKWIYFWGTIYRDSGGRQSVQVLCVRADGSCYSSGHRIGVDFSGDDPAAVAGNVSLDSEPMTKTLDAVNLEIETVIINGRKYRLIENE